MRLASASSTRSGASLTFATGAPMRQYRDFIFFERAEPPRYMRRICLRLRSLGRQRLDLAAKIERLRDAYLAKARRFEATDEAVKAIETYFTAISAQIRQVEKDRLAAEPMHLEALRKFAERAFRRPLSKAEGDDLIAFYNSLRKNDELSHEDAIRDTLASVLLSPHFAFRIDGAEPGTAARPLDPYELASRLSYFLWSSMPDQELLSHAAAGDLIEPSVLIAQTRRMLSDARIRRFATEFAGNWLGFRRFEEHNAVDRERFPAFTNELRQAMYEEPIRLLRRYRQPRSPGARASLWRRHLRESSSGQALRHTCAPGWKERLGARGRCAPLRSRRASCRCRSS